MRRRRSMSMPDPPGKAVSRSRRYSVAQRPPARPRRCAGAHPPGASVPPTGARTADVRCLEREVDMAILLVPDCAHHTSPAASTVTPRGWLPARGLVDAVGNGSTPPATSTRVTTPALKSVSRSSSTEPMSGRSRKRHESKNSTRTGARTVGLTSCVWPSRVRNSACGIARLSARAVSRMNG